MATTLSEQLALEKPDRYTDEIWTPWANNADMLSRALAGYLAIAQGDANYTLRDISGARESRTLALKLTTTLTANREIKIDTTTAGLARGRIFIIWNASSANFKLTVKTTAGGSTGVDINSGFSRPVWHDGTNVYAFGPEISPITGLIGGPWPSWTPTWTNLTVGNGTVVAKYTQIGSTVFCRLSIVFGSTTSVSGSVSFSLPVNRAANAGTAGGTPQGLARLIDASPSATYEGSITNLSTSTSVIIVWDASSTYVKFALLSSTVPFTWATGDEIDAQFSYEAA